MISVTGGSRLDPWVDSYASRANAMRASEIRALFAVASRPEVVSLAGGMPYVQALPIDMLADTASGCCTSVVRRPSSTARGRVTSPCASRSSRSSGRSASPLIPTTSS